MMPTALKNSWIFLPRVAAWFVLTVSAILLAGCGATSPEDGPSSSLLSAPTDEPEAVRDGIDVLGVLSNTFPFMNFSGGVQATSDSTLSAPQIGAQTPVIGAVAAQPIGPSAVGVVGSGNVGTVYSGNLNGFGPGPNVHLWRSSLEVLSFMPMALADPVTGLIQTNWHQSQGNNAERLRVEVFILSDQLRPDALRVNVYRQAINRQTGQWTNAPINQSTARLLENQILERANQRRISAGQGL